MTLPRLEVAADVCVCPSFACSAVLYAEGYEELFHSAQTNSTVAGRQRALQGLTRSILTETGRCLFS